jgi:uncharacterized membrane protein YcfT
VPYAELPIVSLVLGFLGAAAVITFSALIARTFLGTALSYAGARSIVIYLAFFFPMAVSRMILIKLGFIDSVGTISVLVMTAGILAPLVLMFLIEKTGYGRFLFTRPDWAKLQDRRKVDASMVPAE